MSSCSCTCFANVLDSCDAPYLHSNRKLFPVPGLPGAASVPRLVTEHDSTCAVERGGQAAPKQYVVWVEDVGRSVRLEADVSYARLRVSSRSCLAGIARLSFMSTPNMFGTRRSGLGTLVLRPPRDTSPHIGVRPGVLASGKCCSG